MNICNKKRDWDRDRQDKDKKEIQIYIEIDLSLRKRSLLIARLIYVHCQIIKLMKSLQKGNKN